MNNLEAYYNKFNEEKRLNSRHGRIEYTITSHYLQGILDQLEANMPRSEIKILDIGAGTGRYCVPLADAGYDVSAIELVKYNLGILKQKGSSAKAYQGNALKLKRFEDNSFDVALLFGPMYHLASEEDKLKALSEAKRVVKPGGYILVAYVMNDYALVTYAFKEQHVLENLETGRIDDTWHTRCIDETDLYSFVTVSDIERLNEKAGLTRIKIFSPDGPANYIRPFLNQLTEEQYEKFVEYQLSVAERPDLMGAAAHTVDILTV